MRVLLTTWPAATHLFPFVPIAWALRAAGHEVRVACHPALAEAVTDAGLTAVPMGEPDRLPEPLGAGRPLPPATADGLAELTGAMDLAGHDSYVWSYHRDYLLAALRDFQPETARPGDPQPAVDGLVGVCRAWRPDLVLWDPVMPAAAVAAEATGAAHARLLWGPDFFAWAGARHPDHRPGTGTSPAAGPADEGRRSAEDPLTAAVRPMAERYGLETTDELRYGQWTVDPLPEPLRLPDGRRPAVPVRWVPYTGRTVLPDWLAAPPERPRVALTLGASVRVWSQDSALLVSRVLEMVEGLDIEVVATLDKSQLAQAGPVPGNVRTVDYVPLSELLPTCAAMVHHGGHGTLLAGLAAGLPQLVVMDPRYPMEAPLTGRFLARSGAGSGVRADRRTGAELREGLSRLLAAPSFRGAAEALRGELLAAPSPAEIVPVLERLTRRHRRAD